MKSALTLALSQGERGPIGEALLHSSLSPWERVGVRAAVVESRP
jgi:hypothetical protein